LRSADEPFFPTSAAAQYNDRNYRTWRAIVDIEAMLRHHDRRTVVRRSRSHAQLAIKNKMVPARRPDDADAAAGCRHGGSGTHNSKAESGCGARSLVNGRSRV
jgi:hypothetical protein